MTTPHHDILQRIVVAQPRTHGPVEYDVAADVCAALGLDVDEGRYVSFSDVVRLACACYALARKGS